MSVSATTGRALIGLLLCSLGAFNASGCGTATQTKTVEKVRTVTAQAAPAGTAPVAPSGPTASTGQSAPPLSAAEAEARRSGNEINAIQGNCVGALPGWAEFAQPFSLPDSQAIWATRDAEIAFFDESQESRLEAIGALGLNYGGTLRTVTGGDAHVSFFYVFSAEEASRQVALNKREMADGGATSAGNENHRFIVSFAVNDVLVDIYDAEPSRSQLRAITKCLTDVPSGD